MGDRSLEILLRLNAMGNATPHLKKVKDAAGKAAKQVKETRERLKELQRTERDLANAKALQNHLVQLGDKLGRAREKVRALAQQYSAAERPTAALTRKFKEAREAVARLEDEQRQQGRALGELTGKLSAAGRETSDFAGDQKRLRAEIDRTNDELKEQQRRLSEIHTRRANAIRGNTSIRNRAGAVTAGAAAAVATGAIALRRGSETADRYGEFEAGMTDIALKADLTRRAARALGDELLRTSDVVGQMPSDLQAGVNTLTGMGMGAREAVALMRPIGQAATAYREASIDDLSAASFSAVNNLKVDVADIGQVLDIMAEAGKRGSFEIADMATHFPSLTASAQALGQTGVKGVADLAAALQVVRTATGDSASAATNLQNLYQKIYSNRTIKAFKKHGVDLRRAMAAAMAEGMSPVEAITELTRKVLKGDMTRLGELFEDAQVQGALRPLMQQTDLYRQIRDQALGAQGTVARDFQFRQDDGGSAELKIRAELMAAEIALGRELLPLKLQLMKATLGVIKGIAGFAKAHPGMFKLLAVAALIATALAGLTLLIAPIVAAIAMVATAAGVGFAAVLLPVLAVIGAIIALGAAVWMVVTNWDAIVVFFANVWEGVKATFSAFINFVKAKFLSWQPVVLIMAAFNAVWPALTGVVNRFMDFGRNLMDGIVKGIGEKYTAVKKAITGAADRVGTWFKNALGIHSPSRVFAEMGGHLMGGVAQGVRRREGEPIAGVKAAAGRMAAAFTVGAAVAAGGPAAAAAGPGPAAAPGLTIGEIHFHIHQQPGQDGQALAQDVRRMFEEWQREQAVRARRGFGNEADE